jgi:hypothetical protein
MLIKFIDKFYNKKDVPWVHLIWFSHYQGRIPHGEKLYGSFWWRDVLKQVDNFRGVALVSHARGNTSLFWTDNWMIDGSSQPMCNIYEYIQYYFHLYQ